MYDLIRSSSLVSKRLVFQRLAGAGLTSPKAIGVTPEVWILSTDVVPQPGSQIGIWDDVELWVDGNVWYD